MNATRAHLLSHSLLAAGLALALSGCHNLDFSSRVEPGEIDIYDDLFSVSTPDENHTVAAGYRGAVYYSHDAGKTWSKGQVPSDHLLYSVSMADAEVGWAVGQVGTILRTTDGGKTWETQPNLKADEGSHLFSVHAIDRERAWAVGEWGTRIFTSDGGKTWEDQSLPIDLLHPMFVWLDQRDQERVREGEKVYEDVGLNYVYCRPLPSQKCWIVGEFGYIFHSDDLGKTWERGEILGEIRMDPIYFDFNGISISDEDRARLEQFAKEIADLAHLNVLLDAFGSPREIRDFGNSQDPSELFDILSARLDEARSTLEDAGILSDRLRMPNKPPWDYEDFLDDDPGFLQRYLDGRAAEVPTLRVSVIQNPFLFTVDFESDEKGFISGLGGVILASDDSGRSWKYHNTGRKQALFAVGTSDSRAIAVGEKGFVRVSTDGGESWLPPEDGEFPTVFTFMRDIAFDPRDRVGTIVGQQGLVLRSEDGGRNWSQVLPPPKRDST